MSRSVLITGGNTDIGQAIARRFAEQDDWVAVTHQDGEAPEGTLAVRCDVTEPSQVDVAFHEVEEAHGPVEVLVANADITRDGLPGWTTNDDAAATETDLAGHASSARFALKAMLRKRSARIILVTPAAGVPDKSGQVSCAASEAGLIGLARSLAREYGSPDATVNVVAPGPTRTNIAEHVASSTCEPVPATRLAAPEEIAATVVFLASPEASRITGSVIPVTGSAGMSP